MVGVSLASLALLSLAGIVRAVESVQSIISSVFWFDVFAISIFFGGIFGVPLLKLELGLAFYAFNEIAHLPDRFVL